MHLRRWGHNWPVFLRRTVAAWGNVLVEASEAILIDIVTLKVRRTWTCRPSATAVTWSLDGRLVLTGFADTAVLGDATSGGILHGWTHPGSDAGGITSAAFSADGRRVLVGAANYRAILRDTATGRTLRAWKAGNKVAAVVLSRYGRWALPRDDDDWEAGLHDARTVRKWRYESWPTAVAFSSDGRQPFMGFGDGAAIL